MKHFASRRHRGPVAGNRLDQAKAKTRTFYVKLHTSVDEFAHLNNHHRLLKLVVTGTHHTRLASHCGNRFFHLHSYGACLN